MQRTWDIDTGISLLATQAVEGHRCAAQARDAILGHRLYDTRFPFLAKTGFWTAMYLSLQKTAPNVGPKMAPKLMPILTHFWSLLLTS